MNTDLAARERMYEQTMLVPNDHLPVFAVLSWGCAATVWLARALNLHPSISCTDGLRAQVMAAVRLPWWDAVPYLRLVRAHAAAYPLAGDVHSLTASEVPTLREYFGDRLQVCSVVREPRPRINSFLGLARQFDYDLAWCDPMAYLPTVAAAAEILPLLDGGIERPFFAHAVLTCNAILNEHICGPVYRSEDLTTDRATFGRLVGQLSSGALDVDDDLLERVAGLDRVNRHASPDARPAWEPWQDQVFDALLDPEARRLYRDLGYEL